MPRGMAHTGGSLALLVPFALGCSLLPSVRDNIKPPASTAAPGKKPTVESLVEYLNQESSRVQNLRATVDIDAKGGGQAIGLSGRIAAQKPLGFRLMADVLGKSAVDIGSNNDEFWYWISQDKPPYLYHCAYKDLATGKVNVPFPFQPDMVLAALGMAEYDVKGKYELREQPRTWELLQSTTSATGQKVVRITVFNKEIAKPGLPQVLGHVIQDAAGNPICKAIVEKVKEDRDSNTKLPSVVRIEWPSMKMSMKLMLHNIETNKIGRSRFRGGEIQDRHRPRVQPVLSGRPEVRAVRPRTRPCHPGEPRADWRAAATAEVILFSQHRAHPLQRVSSILFGNVRHPC